MEAIAAIASFTYLLWGPVLTFLVMVPFLRKPHINTLPVFLVAVPLLTALAGPVYYRGLFMFAPWWISSISNFGSPDKNYVALYAGILVAVYFLRLGFARSRKSESDSQAGKRTVRPLEDNDP